MCVLCACGVPGVRWLYRIRPSVGHSDLVPAEVSPQFIGDLSKLKADPAQVGHALLCWCVCTVAVHGVR